MYGYANRGMGLESLINFTNEVYVRKQMAVVHKRPTPVKILSARGAKVEGYLETASTVDYEGVYHGYSLQFEAKSTNELHRISLANFQEHQVEHMRACIKQGAVVFALVQFASRNNTTFYVPGTLIIDAWDRHKAGARASIPYDDLAVQCFTVRSSRGVPLDYLTIVDKVIEQKNAS